MYCWILDYNKYERKGITGPKTQDPNLQSALAKGEGEKFEMLDADGELYCRGRIIGNYDGFEPLDDYGKPALGCTDIYYNGKRL